MNAELKEMIEEKYVINYERLGNFGQVSYPKDGSDLIEWFFEESGILCEIKKYGAFQAVSFKVLTDAKEMNYDILTFKEGIKELLEIGWDLNIPEEMVTGVIETVEFYFLKNN